MKNKMKFYGGEIIFFCLFSSMVTAQPSEKWDGYWEKRPPIHEHAKVADYPELFSSSALVWIRIYQTVIASQDLPSCVFHPSCSRFAFDAIKQYGAIKGILLSTDRLMRCNPFAYKYYQFDGSKFADPVLKYQIPDKNAQPTNLKK